MEHAGERGEEGALGSIVGRSIGNTSSGFAIRDASPGGVGIMG